MGMVQSTAEIAETVIGHPDSELAAFRPLASFRKVNGKNEFRAIDIDEPPEVKHKRNVLASELLLKRLRRLHFEHSPDSWKNKFLPVPIYPTLVAEFLRANVDLAPVPSQPRPLFGNLTDPEIVRAMAEAEWVAKNIRKVPMKLIVAVAAKYYGVSPTDIIGPYRHEKIIRARMACYFLGKNLCGYSMPEIGRRLGGRNHTSVLSGLRKMKRLMEANDPVAMQLETLRAQVVHQFEQMQVRRTA